MEYKGAVAWVLLFHLAAVGVAWTQSVEGERRHRRPFAVQTVNLSSQAALARTALLEATSQESAQAKECTRCSDSRRTNNGSAIAEKLGVVDGALQAAETLPETANKVGISKQKKPSKTQRVVQNEKKMVATAEHSQSSAVKKMATSIAEKGDKQSVSSLRTIQEVKRKGALLQQAKETVAKIPPSEDKIGAKYGQQTSKISDAAPLQTFQMSDFEGHPELSYSDALAHALQRQLCLPEYGRVEVALTISCSGGVVRIVVVKAESERNRAYLLEAIPKVILPSFGAYCLRKEEKMFTIALNNAS